MIKLSAIIIAKNEERNIARCIDSLFGVIDEIVVFIDSGTTDNTIDIVKTYPNIKHQVVEWKGYSETKKAALKETSSNWIFWIDADECITKELKEELNDFKNSQPEYFAYSIPRKAFFLGKWIKHSGWYPGRVTRLFNKKEVSFSQNDVHEHLIVKGGTGELKRDLEHYTDPSIEHYFLKFNKYTTLAAEELKKKGKKAGLSDLLLRPLNIFVKMYLIKLGFLDGVHGFILAVFSSLYVFTKYCKLWELDNNSNMRLK
jgi:(heptosyl)LPS beta-1,4-glucosyltransferase